MTAAPDEPLGRLERITATGQPNPALDDPADAQLRESYTALGKLLQTTITPIDESLVLAGVRRRLARKRFRGLALAAGLAAGVLAALVGFLVLPRSTQAPIVVEKSPANSDQTMKTAVASKSIPKNKLDRTTIAKTQNTSDANLTAKFAPKTWTEEIDDEIADAQSDLLLLRENWRTPIASLDTLSDKLDEFENELSQSTL